MSDPALCKQFKDVWGKFGTQEEYAKDKDELYIFIEKVKQGTVFKIEEQEEAHPYKIDIELKFI